MPLIPVTDSADRHTYRSRRRKKRRRNRDTPKPPSTQDDSEHDGSPPEHIDRVV